MAPSKKKLAKVTPILSKQIAALKNIENLIEWTKGDGWLCVHFPKDGPPAWIHNFEHSTIEYKQYACEKLSIIAADIMKKASDE